MPYQVKAGSFTFVVPTIPEALRALDDLRRFAIDEPVIRDMNGETLDIERLRAMVQDKLSSF